MKEEYEKAAQQRILIQQERQDVAEVMAVNCFSKTARRKTQMAKYIIINIQFI